MVEIVSQIKTAEEQADEVRKSARTQARQIKEEALVSGKELTDSEGLKAAAQASKIVEKAEIEAQKYLDEFAAGSVGECDGLASQASGKMAKAAGFIVERIVAGL